MPWHVGNWKWVFDPHEKVIGERSAVVDVVISGHTTEVRQNINTF